MDPDIVKALMRATSWDHPNDVAQILTRHPNVVNAAQEEEWVRNLTAIDLDRLQCPH